jgi:hypothetical protein
MKMGSVFITVLLITTMLAVGCAVPTSTPGPSTQPPTPGPPTGTIKVLVTDAPGDVSEVNVTVSEVEVHKAGGDGESGEWITLPIQEETFDLIALQDITMLLAEGNEVEAGKYTQLRMTVFEVIVKTEDGPEDGYQATVPSDKLKFVRPFTLEGGDTITLITDFDAAKSVIFPGGKKGDVNKVIFKPVVKLLIEHEEEPGPPAPTGPFEPISGPVETEITVTDTGWEADEDITSVTVGGEAATHTLTVDGDGNLSGTITVPELDPGVKDIVITGATSGEQTFLNAFTVTATAAFDPTSGPVETEITVTGTGWVADEDITSVEFDGEAATHTLTVDGDGNLSGTITVPAGLSSVTYSIVITGEESGEQTFPNAFTVT